MTNKVAPDFELQDQTGACQKLSDYRGRWVVLYFYPKDESLGCTKQACSFRDEYRIIKQFGNAEVIGINHNSVDSHAMFAKHHKLQFPILSDPGHKITSTYNSWRAATAKVFGSSYATQRNTFLINPDGEIAKTYKGVRNGSKHTEQVIDDLQRLQVSFQKHEA
jgi:thioredoxin-dependent peroxiredoxin